MMLKRSGAVDKQLWDRDYSTRRRRPTSRRGAVPSRGRVLVVDDDPQVLRAQRRLLAERYDVETAASVAEAVEKLKENGFFAILTDYEMPGQNGLALLENVKEQYPGMMRVLVSGSDPMLVAPHVLSGLVETFLPKPTNRAALLMSLSCKDRF